MQTVTVDVARDPETCWRAFVDVGQLPRWVPGLKRAEIITRAKGLPEEVHFEFARELAYTLVYSYDKEERVVRWQPKLGKNAGVSGFVRFEAIENGWTRITYGLEQGDARGPAERELGDLQRLAEAFRSHVQR
ncbi:MAG TPA: SRPBCC family protein [Kofleriaceae bacterium]|nr:SRPBCC family protein [Kofleriaceae bacterium]